MLNYAWNISDWGVTFYVLSFTVIVVDYYKSWESYSMLYPTNTNKWLNFCGEKNALFQVWSSLPFYLRKPSMCVWKSACLSYRVVKVITTCYKHCCFSSLDKLQFLYNFFTFDFSENCTNNWLALGSSLLFHLKVLGCQTGVEKCAPFGLLPLCFIWWPLFLVSHVKENSNFQFSLLVSYMHSGKWVQTF